MDREDIRDEINNIEKEKKDQIELNNKIKNDMSDIDNDIELLKQKIQEFSKEFSVNDIKDSIETKEESKLSYNNQQNNKNKNNNKILSNTIEEQKFELDYLTQDLMKNIPKYEKSTIDWEDRVWTLEEKLNNVNERLILIPEKYKKKLDDIQNELNELEEIKSNLEIEIKRNESDHIKESFNIEQEIASLNQNNDQFISKIEIANKETKFWKQKLKLEEAKYRNLKQMKRKLLLDLSEYNEGNGLASVIFAELTVGEVDYINESLMISSLNDYFQPEIEINKEKFYKILDDEYIPECITYEHFSIIVNRLIQNLL